MKTLSKIWLTMILSAFIAININAQPKSEIVEDNETKINWAGADTLYTFQFDEQLNKWIYYQREIRRFNEGDLPLENFVQVWNTKTNKWANYLKVNYAYDENGNEIEAITQQWDENFNNWLNASLKTTTYKGRKKEEILFQDWKKPANEWFNVMKYLLKYNDNGTESNITISLYNGITKSWDNHKRFLMEFDGYFAPPSTVISENWKSNNWETVGKYDLTYNGRNKKTSEIRYTYNQSNKRWLEGIKVEMEYDKKGNQISYQESKYDSKNKSWLYFNKSTSVYNEEGYMTEKTEYKWDRTSGQWELSDKFKFTTEATM